MTTVTATPAIATGTDGHALEGIDKVGLHYVAIVAAVVGGRPLEVTAAVDVGAGRCVQAGGRWNEFGRLRSDLERRIIVCLGNWGLSWRLKGRIDIYRAITIIIPNM